MTSWTAEGIHDFISNSPDYATRVIIYKDPWQLRKLFVITVEDIPNPDRLRLQCSLLANSDAIKEIIDFSDDTRRLFTENDTGRDFHGKLRLFGEIGRAHV